MKIKNIIIGIIIAVVFLMFAVYGTKLVYDAPVYEDFCKDNYPAPLEKIGNCTISSELNLKIQDCYNQRGNPISVYDEQGCQKDVNCDLCQINWDETQEHYSKNLFIISLIVGLIVIIISAFFLNVESVSGGLMFGSLMYIIYGTGSYWRFMNDWLRFIILGIALGILIYVGYRLARK